MQIDLSTFLKLLWDTLSRQLVDAKQMLNAHRPVATIVVWSRYCSFVQTYSLLQLKPPSSMARRLYLGSGSPFFSVYRHATVDCCYTGLPPDARSDDVSKFFEGYGRIIDCRVMTGSSDKKDPNNTRLNKPSSGFGFIEFENSKATSHSYCSFFSAH
jgi:hypothetical protein